MHLGLTHRAWLLLVSALLILGASAPAIAQLDGLKDKLKKKANDATQKEIDKALKGNKKGEGTQDGKGDQSDGTGGAPGVAGGGAAGTAGALHALEFAPTRVVPLGTLGEDVGVDGIVFSPELDRAAWIGRKGSRQTVYVNGVAGVVGDEVMGAPIFSRDGSRVAYVVRRGDAQHLVIDGQESAGFMHIEPGSICFSDDGARYAAVGYREVDGESKSFVITDGAEQGAFDGLSGLRFVKDRLVYSRFDYDEHGNGSPVFVCGDDAFPTRSSRYTWHSGGLIEAERLIGRPMAILAVGDSDERLMVGEAVGPVVRDIRSIEASADGRGWAYIAAEAGDGDGGDGPVHVLVVNGDVVRRITGRGADDARQGVRVVFSESGTDYALVEQVGYNGMRVLHGERTDPEYDAIGYLRLKGDGEISYWAAKDHYVYRVVNGEESEGIAGRIEGLETGLDALQVVRGMDAPVMIFESVPMKDSRGREYKLEMARIALGSSLSARGERIDSFGVSGDGTAIGVLVGGAEGRDEGCWAICGETAYRISESSMNGVEGEWRLDEQGANSVLIATARGREKFPADAAGGVPIRHTAAGVNGESLHLLRNGLWKGDLYAGREITHRTRVRGLTITRDLRHTFNWLGAPQASDGSAFDPGMSWTLVFDGRTLHAPAPLFERGPKIVPAVNPSYPYQPFEAEAVACGSLNADGTAFRYVARDGDVISLVAYDIAALESAASD